MQLKRYISQDGLPSRAPTSPVDFQDFTRMGRSVEALGRSVQGFGEDVYQADAPQRALRRQQEKHLLDAEEDLAVQESLTSFKTISAEVMERRRQEYSPGASDENKNITEFATNTVAEMRDLMEMDAFSNLSGAARSRFRSEALKHIDSLIPDLNKARTDMLVSKSEARLGMAEEVARQQANSSPDEAGVFEAMDRFSTDLYQAVQSKTLGLDKAVERSTKFNQQAAKSWFDNLNGRDPEALFMAMQAPTPEQAALLGMIDGKDSTAFRHDRERRVLESIDRKRKDAERDLKDSQDKIENNFWDDFYRNPRRISGMFMQDKQDELKKLPPERYKSIMKSLGDARDDGGIGDEGKMNYWKMQLFHSSAALSGEDILNMSQLNWKQRQELYQAKRTQTEFEHAQKNEKHWSNDPNYKFYSHELQDQLGIIKISPFTNASALQLLSQAEIAYRNEYERLHAEKKGMVTQDEANELMKRIVGTTRQALGFKAQVYGEVPRYDDPAKLEQDFNEGKISSQEFTKEWRKLQAWRAMQAPQEGAQDSGTSPKKDYKKHGKE